MKRTHAINFFKSPKKQRFFFSLLTRNHTQLQQIYSHPFNIALFKGILHPTTFEFYLKDDFIYLQQFSLSLNELSIRCSASNPQLSADLLYLSEDVVESEKQMQIHYKKQLQYHNNSKAGTVISSYIEHQKQSISNQPFPVALCSVLPCFWIYYQLGIIHQDTSKNDDNPYKEWISTYSSASFINATLMLADSVDCLAENSSHEVKQLIQYEFQQGTQYELAFFNDVWSKSQIEDYHLSGVLH